MGLQEQPRVLGGGDKDVLEAVNKCPKRRFEVISPQDWDTMASIVVG